MKIKYGFALLLITGILVFWGCKTTETATETVAEAPAAPQPQSPQAAPQPQSPQASPTPSGPDQAALNALNTAIARAEKERKLAEDFESPSYFPAEWRTAETEYRSITVDRTSTATVQAAERRYNAVADTYQALFQKTVPLYADDVADEVLTARDAVIAAGIEDYVSDYPYFDMADEAALAAESAYYAEDYYKAAAGAEEAIAWYTGLYIAVETLKVRDEAIVAGIEDYAPDSLELADEILLAAGEAFLVKDYDKAMTGAQEAQDRYRSLKAGMEAYH
jgi:hypothetical protein